MTLAIAGRCNGLVMDMVDDTGGCLSDAVEECNSESKHT